MGPMLLTAEEVAQALGVGRTTVYRLMSNGELRGVRIGTSRRFTQGEVEAFVERLSGTELGSGPGS